MAYRYLYALRTDCQAACKIFRKCNSLLVSTLFDTLDVLTAVFCVCPHPAIMQSCIASRRQQRDDKALNGQTLAADGEGSSVGLSPAHPPHEVLNRPMRNIMAHKGDGLFYKG